MEQKKLKKQLKSLKRCLRDRRIDENKNKNKNKNRGLTLTRRNLTGCTSIGLRPPAVRDNFMPACLPLGEAVELCSTTIGMGNW